MRMKQLLPFVKFFCFDRCSTRIWERNGKSMLTAISGINWGDEGKGRMVDLLSENADIVARYQGGNNAGHTVINEFGEFKLNLLPSGIFRSNVVNVMGGGMVIDLKHLVEAFPVPRLI